MYIFQTFQFLTFKLAHYPWKPILLTISKLFDYERKHVGYKYIIQIGEQYASIIFSLKMTR